MEINKPDKGLFKGIGGLQVDLHINKKYFPNVRNIHQFDYTHQHKNNYVTSFQRFFSANKTHGNINQPIVKKYANQSSL